MQRSTDRFLTTHTGSLPRPDDLVRLMFAHEEGAAVDAGALALRVHEAVAEMVRRQIDAGIDIVNDGEMSKPSYATYVKDRLRRLRRQRQYLRLQDLVDYPRSAARVFGDPGRKARKGAGLQRTYRRFRSPIAPDRHGNSRGGLERRDAVSRAPRRRA